MAIGMQAAGGGDESGDDQPGRGEHRGDRAWWKDERPAKESGGWESDAALRDALETRNDRQSERHEHQRRQHQQPSGPQDIEGSRAQEQPDAEPSGCSGKGRQVGLHACPPAESTPASATLRRMAACESSTN